MGGTTSVVVQVGRLMIRESFMIEHSALLIQKRFWKMSNVCCWRWRSKCVRMINESVVWMDFRLRTRRGGMFSCRCLLREVQISWRMA